MRSVAQSEDKHTSEVFSKWFECSPRTVEEFSTDSSKVRSLEIALAVLNPEESGARVPRSIKSGQVGEGHRWSGGGSNTEVFVKAKAAAHEKPVTEQIAECKSFIDRAKRRLAKLDAERASENALTSGEVPESLGPNLLELAPYSILGVP